MNKRTTDSYFPFFGVPYHFILHTHQKIRAWKFGWGAGRGGGLIFGPRIFLVSSGIQEFCNGKTALENNGDCSCNGIPITCSLELEFFFFHANQK